METIPVSYNVPVEPAVDVLVIGGGSSGIAAATAAARGGARTALVERYGFLGGTSTAGMVGPFMTSYSADGTEQVIAGIFQEMVDRMVALGGAIDPGETEAGSAHAGFIEYGHAHVTPFHVEALKLAALEMTAEAGVRHRFHTWFVDALTETTDHRRPTTDRQNVSSGPSPVVGGQSSVVGGRITGALVLDKGGLRALPARIVIDTSADGDVSVRAGADYVVGRADGKMMPATMFFRVGSIDDARLAEWMEAHRKLHPGERLFECLVQKAKAEGNWHIPREYINLYREPRPGEYRVNTTRLHDIDGTNPDDLSRAELEGRRQVAQVIRFLRDYCPGCENAQLLETGAQIGIRETRHILGDYLLTGEDVLRGATFPDAIARCSYPIDIHDPTGTRGTLLGPQEQGRNWYEIPYRCLVPRGVENLLVAGRCLSASHEGAASARVIPPCYATGQAAGAAAALALELGVTPREVPAEVLRERLRAAGAIV